VILRQCSQATSKKKSGIVILLFGSLLREAIDAADELDAALVNMRFVKPLDEVLIRKMSNSHDLIVTLEDNAVQGGAGSAVSEFLNRENLQTPVINLGIPDDYIEHATREEQLEEINLSGTGIVQQIKLYNSGKYCKLTSASVA